MSYNVDFGSLYRRVIMDHYKSPKNKGPLAGEHLTIDMNNPTCGDRIHLHLQVQDGMITDVKFEGDGCSISIASASMMTQAIKGKTVEYALELSHIFSDMMLGKEYEGDIDLDDLEALSGVSQFPARIRCATLAWKAMEKGCQE